jgi:hypothetical protein
VPRGSNGWEVATDTAVFYFFEPGNLEVMIKVLNGCSLNGHWWVFAAGLTDQFVKIEVSTWRDGAESKRSYESTGGEAFKPIIDLEAFACEA